MYNWSSKRNKLNFYKTYWDRTEKIKRNAEEAAPLAITDIRKGLPILDRNLKEFLEEIQRKVRIIVRNREEFPQSKSHTS